MDFITTLGLTAAMCTTISFIPQALKTIRTRNTRDLSLGMYSILTIGVFLWLMYGIFRRDLSIILANAVTIVFAAIILMMKIRYK